MQAYHVTALGWLKKEDEQVLFSTTSGWYHMEQFIDSITATVETGAAYISCSNFVDTSICCTAKSTWNHYNTLISVTMLFLAHLYK